VALKSFDTGILLSEGLDGKSTMLVNFHGVVVRLREDFTKTL
jgi:hypothetical protein